MIKNESLKETKAPPIHDGLTEKVSSLWLPEIKIYSLEYEILDFDLSLGYSLVIFSSDLESHLSKNYITTKLYNLCSIVPCTLLACFQYSVVFLQIPYLHKSIIYYPFVIKQILCR